MLGLPYKLAFSLNPPPPSESLGQFKCLMVDVAPLNNVRVGASSSASLLFTMSTYLLSDPLPGGSVSGAADAGSFSSILVYTLSVRHCTAVPGCRAENHHHHKAHLMVHLEFPYRLLCYRREVMIMISCVPTGWVGMIFIYVFQVS